MEADPADRGERVLVLAPIGRDGPAAAALLQKLHIAADICGGLSELRDALAAGAGVAVVAEEAFYREPLEPLIDWVDGQPSWSDFPFVVLTVGHGTSADEERRRRLLAALRNASLLERPIQTVTLMSTVQSALRARRRQYEMRGHFREREQAAIRLEGLVAERTRELEESNRHLQGEIVEREQAEAALRQSQKMEVIGQLTGGIAHDFNNLLATVLGNLELATLQVTSEKVRRLVSNAEHAAWRGAKLTEQLLAFARKQRLEPQTVDLNALVPKMGDLLFRTIGGTVRIETVLEKDIWPAFVDPTQIELVILNLAINGRDAMPGGGRLTIATANIGADDPRIPGELRPGDYVAVSVADTGVGMTGEVLAKAFEPFFTTKDVGQGTGLGLSQVYGVARQSGGTVRIETQLGRGTEITVYLPRAAAQAAAERSREAIEAPPGHYQRGMVLVVDDDPDVRAVAVGSLEALGHTVIAAESGRTALDLLDRGIPVDLMLVDYAMPGVNGVEAARLVRAKRPELRVLIMTGYADIAALNGVPGVAGILKKPFSLAELAARIEGILQGRAMDTPPARAKVDPIGPSKSP
jgi:signal transduction histidine kinase/CheY-like chemotaxis protein